MSDHDSEERAIRWYASLLRLYPAQHRNAFGAQMLQTFRDHYRDIREHQRGVGVAFWLAVVGDEARNITKEQVIALRTRRILPMLLSIGASLFVAGLFLWLPGYILSLKLPAALLLLIGFAAKRLPRISAATHKAVGHRWMRQGVRYGSVLGLLWVALNLADHLSANESPLRNFAKLLDVSILLLGMPILFGLAGFMSGRSSGAAGDGTLAGLLAAAVGAGIMVVSLVAIMLVCWDTVRGTAFQSAEMIRAWHASGDQSFGRYLWGDNLGGALDMTILSLLFGGLLGTLGGVLGSSRPKRGDGAGRAVMAPPEGIG
jgi:hypothetical protein